MAMSVVVVPSGGIGVTESASGNAVPVSVSSCGVVIA